MNKYVSVWFILSRSILHIYRENIDSRLYEYFWLWNIISIIENCGCFSLCIQVHFANTNSTSEIPMSDQSFGNSGKSNESSGEHTIQSCNSFYLLLFSPKLVFYWFFLICRNNAKNNTGWNHYILKNWKWTCWHRWYFEYCEISNYI